LSTAATVPPADGVFNTVTVLVEFAVKVAVQVVFAEAVTVVDAFTADAGVWEAVHAQLVK